MSNEPSPRPWRVEDDQIFDANGFAVTPIDENAGISDANMSLIADAVNLYDRIEKARTDVQGNKCILSLGVEQPIVIMPPLSEAEQIRMFRDQCDAFLKDRIRFQGNCHELAEVNGRLREFVRRLANMAESALVEIDNYTDRYLHLIDFVNEGRALIREARAAISESAHCQEENGGTK